MENQFNSFTEYHWVKQKKRRHPLPLHTEVATGEHPEHGEFRVLMNLPQNIYFVQIKGDTYTLTLQDLMDDFFEMLEGPK